MPNDEFVEMNKKTIHSLLYKRYPTFPHNDMYQEGVLKSLEVKKTYDDTKGTKFNTWLIIQLRSHLTKYAFSRMGSMHIPHIQHKDFKGVSRIPFDSEAEETDYDLIEEAGVTITRLEKSKIEYWAKKLIRDYNADLIPK